MTTIPPGVVVELVALRGDWYQTSLKFDADRLARPFGWIQRQTVELLPAQAQEQLSTAHEVAPQQPRTLAAEIPAPERVNTVAAPPTPQPSARLPQVRDGFWFNAGGGYGSVGCDGCLNRLGGFSGGLSLGGTLSPRVLLGVGTTGWYRSDAGETMGTLDARLRFYPLLTSGFFITGGFGLGHVSDAYETVWGPGAVVGLGWDVRVSRNVSLTPFWNGFAMSSEFVDRNVGQLGLGVTIH
jgi:hypothetical protein